MKLLSYIISLYFLIVTNSVFAQTVVPLINQSDRSGEYEAGRYKISAPFEGISYNLFSAFDTGGDDLIIDNDTVFPAETIVISSPSIRLNSKITLSGVTANVIFIASEEGEAVSCKGCSISGARRISFIASEKLIDTDFDAPIYIDGAGLINIDSIKTTGASLVEFIAGSISLAGDMRFNEKGRKRDDGVLEKDPDGSYFLGETAVRVYSGEMEYDYGLMIPRYMKPTQDFSSWSGSVEASDIKVVSSGGFRLSASYYLTPDILVATQTSKGVVVPEAGMTVTSVGGGIEFHGQIVADGAVRFNSNLDVAFLPGSSVSSETLSVVSRNSTYNYGRLSTKSGALEGAAGRFVNQGEISSEFKVMLWGEQELLNEYGGSIHAPVVLLESKYGLVRNGQRINYKFSDGKIISDAVSPVSRFDMPLTVSGIFYETNGSDAAERVRVSNLSAKIFGDIVEISSRAFENINPYWKEIKYPELSSLGDPVIHIDYLKEGRVEVNANSRLTISSRDYLINSSAILTVTSPLGSLDIETDFLSNERYRMMNILDYSEDESYVLKHLFLSKSSIFPVYTDKPRNSDFYNRYTKYRKFFVKPYVYSPPGVIRSAGGFKFYTDSYYGVVNNFSYFDITGDAYFNNVNDKLLRVEDRGIELGKKLVMDNVEGYWRKGGLAGLTYDEYYISPNEMDSLFYVGGRVYGKNATLNPSTVSALDIYLSNAYKDYVGPFINKDELLQDGCTSFEGVFCRREHIEDGDRYSDVDSNFSDLIGEDKQEIGNLNITKSVYEYSVRYQGPVPVGFDKAVVKEKKESLSLLDVLFEYYEKISEKLSDYINDLLIEVNWQD